MPYPKAAQIKGGKSSRTHGVYSLQNRGQEALDAEGRQVLAGIEQSLSISKVDRCLH